MIALRQVINQFLWNWIAYKNGWISDEELKTAINNYISAYADNELDINENLKLKKIIITKPKVRKQLENIYSLKELLKNSFEKTKPQEDFSNKIIKSVYNQRIKTKNRDIVYTLISFIILSIIWVVMLFYSI